MAGLIEFRKLLDKELTEGEWLFIEELFKAVDKKRNTRRKVINDIKKLGFEYNSKKKTIKSTALGIANAERYLADIDIQINFQTGESTLVKTSNISMAERKRNIVEKENKEKELPSAKAENKLVNELINNGYLETKENGENEKIIEKTINAKEEKREVIKDTGNPLLEEENKQKEKDKQMLKDIKDSMFNQKDDDKYQEKVNDIKFRLLDRSQIEILQTIQSAVNSNSVDDLNFDLLDSIRKTQKTHNISTITTGENGLKTRNMLEQELRILDTQNQQLREQNKKILEDNNHFKEVIKTLEGSIEMIKEIINFEEEAMKIYEKNRVLLLEEERKRQKELAKDEQAINHLLSADWNDKEACEKAIDHVEKTNKNWNFGKYRAAAIAWTRENHGEMDCEWQSLERDIEWLMTTEDIAMHPNDAKKEQYRLLAKEEDLANAAIMLYEMHLEKQNEDPDKNFTEETLAGRRNECFRSLVMAAAHPDSMFVKGMANTYLLDQPNCERIVEPRDLSAQMMVQINRELIQLGVAKRPFPTGLLYEMIAKLFTLEITSDDRWGGMGDWDSLMPVVVDARKDEKERTCTMEREYNDKCYRFVKECYYSARNHSPSAIRETVERIKREDRRMFEEIAIYSADYTIERYEEIMQQQKFNQENPMPRFLTQ